MNELPKMKNQTAKIFCGLLLALSAICANAQDAAEDAAPATVLPTTYEAMVAALPEASYDDKELLLQKISQSGNPQAPNLLHALLDGRLMATEAGKVYISQSSDEALAAKNLSDAITGAAVTGVNAESISPIGTNNRLRKGLRALCAQLDLASADADARSKAVQSIMRDLDEAGTAALRARLPLEKESSIQKSISSALALADLQSADANIRLAAVETLSGDISSEVYNGLTTLITKNDDGSFTEPDLRVRTAAAEGIRKIETRRKAYGALETLFFGLSLGSVLVLAAIGLAITFGVMGVINMAHGELIMLGAYTTYVMQLLMPQHIALSLFLSVPAAFLVSGLVGVGIERGIVRFLHGRPLETLLATFGLSLVLQQLVRSVFSPLNRSVASPEFMSGSLVINDAFSVTYNRLYIVFFMLIVFAALQLILKRTSLGLKVRAVSQNRAMARAMGVRTEWIDAATFGLGSGIAGVAGVALSQLTNVGPNLGQAYIIDSFMVVVFGGVGSLWGTLISGMSLGVVNKLLEPWAGAVMAKILVLVFLIVFIQKRPRGLFPQKGRSVEN